MARTLSVIIPVRNAAATVGPLIDRLHVLERPAGWEVEIIAGYSPSKDGTLEALTSRGVRVIECPPTGPAAGRNRPARASRGSLLYFIDADCLPHGDDFLVRLVRIAEELGEFGAFGGPILTHPAQRANPVALADHYACWFNWLERRESDRTTLFAPSVSLVMRRPVFEAVGGFDERIRVLEDWELQERVKRRGWPLYFRADLPVIHRDRGTPAASWRHSWYWGTTYRETFLKVAQPHWPWLHRPGLFWLNLPRLFQHRVRLVVRQAWAVSRRDTLICFPFLLATILAWALSVCVARRPAVRPEDAGG